METPPLLELMSQQAAAERESLLASAAQEATRIREAARSRAAERRATATAELEAELKYQADRSRERAEATAGMVVKTTRDTIADEVLASAAAALRDLAQSEGFSAILDALLAEVLAGVEPDGEYIVLVPPAHVDHCKAWLADNGHGGLEVQPLAGLNDGVAIQDPGRSFRVTNTLSARFARRESELRKLSLNRLFGGE